eukprot:TRINITY_DN6999_c0_g1_i1.p1 TRINITY_DN6999_c0_g1~~TRINITY_DN6999_c0_g1_i1.p1  ORF type:complete len:227 (+),score=29.40 TRINITY_DN6999_c0_g1_i1:173-853(+)
MVHQQAEYYSLMYRHIHQQQQLQVQAQEFAEAQAQARVKATLLSLQATARKPQPPPEPPEPPRHHLGKPRINTNSSTNSQPSLPPVTSPHQRNNDDQTSDMDMNTSDEDDDPIESPTRRKVDLVQQVPEQEPKPLPLPAPLPLPSQEQPKKPKSPQEGGIIKFGFKNYEKTKITYKNKTLLDKVRTQSSSLPFSTRRVAAVFGSTSPETARLEIGEPTNKAKTETN